MTADSLWPWRPLTLHFLANSEPPPSDRRVLPCGVPSHHADKNKAKELWALRGCFNTVKWTWLLGRDSVYYTSHCLYSVIWNLSHAYSQCYGCPEMLRSGGAVKRCWGGPWTQLRGWASAQTRARETVSSNVCNVNKTLSRDIPTPSLTSVMAWMDAPYLTSSSITFTLFFLQAMWRGVKPFW